MVRNTIYFRFAHRDYTKGSALGAITRELGLGAQNCFAVGDHLNDLSMLNRSYAQQLTCPANAH